MRNYLDQLLQMQKKNIKHENEKEIEPEKKTN